MAKSETSKRYLHIAIALIIFIVVNLLLHPGNGLTDKGVITVALFAGTIWLWIFVGVDWPSLLVPGALIAFGVMSQTQMLAVSFGNMCFAYVLTTMLVNVALEDTGVIEKVATWFISRKMCKGRPWVFLGMFLFSCVFLEFFLDCVPVTLIYLVMADRICQMLGYEKGSRFGQALVYSILVLVIIPYGATPISHPGAVLMMGFLEQVGLPITAGQYMAVGVPFSLLALVIVMLILKFMVRPDFTKFDAYDPDEMRKSLKPLDAKGKVAVVIFIAIVFCWLAPDIFKAFAPEFAGIFSQMGFVAPPTLGVALLAVIHIDDKPILNVKKDLFRIPLPTLIFSVGIQAFANTLTNEATGVSTWLGNIFAPFAESIPGGAVVWITLLLTIVMTQFLSNIVVLNLIWAAFMPVLMALNASGGSFNIAAWGVVMVLVANVAFMFPSASVCSPMCFTSGYLEVKHGISYGLPAVVILYVIACVLCYPMACVLM